MFLSIEFRHFSYFRWMRKILAFTALITLIVSCKKTPVLESSEAVVGEWIHYSSTSEAHQINIAADGTGNIEWIYDGAVTRATKIRDWYLTDNILSLGKAAFNGESYEIDSYPQVAWEEMIQYYDTIPELSRYMIIDGVYYTELN